LQRIPGQVETRQVFPQAVGVVRLARRLQLRRNKMTTQKANMGWIISVGKAGAISAWQAQRV
jgi:hypothetical protein